MYLSSRIRLKRVRMTDLNMSSSAKPNGFSGTAYGPVSTIKRKKWWKDKARWHRIKCRDEF
jgi:hypothetical protein